MIKTPSHTCASCGATHTGRYCPACGERRLETADRTLVVLFRSAFEAITDLDSRVWRTLKTLAIRPGELTEKFRIGSRRPYLSPIQLFLTANLVYFLAQPLTGYNSFNSSLSLQVNDQFYSKSLAVDSMVAEKRTELGIDEEAFRMLYNNQSEVLAKSLIILMVPFIALTLALITIGSSRLLVDHMVFVLHFLSFELLFVHSVFLWIWPNLLIALLQTTNSVHSAEMTFVFLTEFGSFLLVTLPYLFIAIHRAYDLTLLRSTISSIVLAVTFLATMLCYRLVLLLVTLATV